MGATLWLLLLLLTAAHALGALFARLRQPRVVGEILGGALLGPTVLGSALPQLGLPADGAPGPAVVTELAYHTGLLLLMVLSGARMHALLGPDDRRAVAWLAGVGTALPFLVTLALTAAVPLTRLQGPAASPLALALVLGIAAAVTSIPVISRIFRDLGLLETRFARLVLGVAVVEDVALWAVLAVAGALARSAQLDWGGLAHHLTLTGLYLLVALLVAPRAVRWLQNRPGVALPRTGPLGWLALVLGLYAVIADLAGVSLVFAAFFAGIALDARQEPLRRRLDGLERFAYALPIPLYFAVVGYRLDFGPGFDLPLLAALLAGACLVKLGAVLLGAALAGFRGRDALDLAIATNARGGPGIVLASVAHEAGIVNAFGYTSLVLLALVTSQAAGAWLQRAMGEERALLGE